VDRAIAAVVGIARSPPVLARSRVGAIEDDLAAHARPAPRSRASSRSATRTTRSAPCDRRPGPVLRRRAVGMVGRAVVSPDVPVELPAGRRGWCRRCRARRSPPAPTAC
jgi:hypothetical protein